MSNPRSGMPQMNGNTNRRHPTLNRNNSNDKSSSSASYNDRSNHNERSSYNEKPSHSDRSNYTEKPNNQHDYLVKYVNDSWNAVSQELEKNTGTTRYYKEENHNLKDFRPFNLEAFWGRRAVQYYQQNQTRHS